VLIGVALTAGRAGAIGAEGIGVRETEVAAARGVVIAAGTPANPGVFAESTETVGTAVWAKRREAVKRKRTVNNFFIFISFRYKDSFFIGFLKG
jgi:hypothetical protein